MRDQMTYAGHAKAILLLGLPLVGGHLAQMAIQITDTLMMGWYSIPGLAAMVLAGTFWIVAFIFSIGFSQAVLPMVAEASERGEEGVVRLRRVTRMGFWLSAFAWAAFQPAFWFSGPILVAMGQDPELSAMAQGYLRIAGVALLPALLTMVLKSYLSALERTQVLLWIAVIAAVVNVFLNWVLIFGNLGAPELGLKGAAWASLTGHLLSVALLALYARRILPEHGIFHRLWRGDGDALRQVFALGWPIGLTLLAEVGLFAFSSLLMGWIGTIALAAHGIAIQIASATFMVHLGLSNAATIRAGKAFGRVDEPGLRRGAAVSIALSVAWALATLVAYLVFPAFLVGLFVDPNEPAREAIIATGIGLMAMAALFQLFDGAQVTAMGLLRGVQDIRVPMWIAAVSYWGVGAPLAWGFGFPLGWGGMGVWFGLAMGLAVAGILLLWRFWGRSVRIGAALAPGGEAAA
ncbi:MATE family efflux transporter [Vannielia litorea]|uniref:MATE family efflux transporter n=1 Tax=Vannielia litorea TaxID=1217970 RepID=UPI001BCF9EE0|nr:MATE family efflux transporter [Vannielia litorea]MBS8228800.1 MATE family efflux transporter [Vannielia litorea]